MVYPTKLKILIDFHKIKFIVILSKICPIIDHIKTKVDNFLEEIKGTGLE